MKRVFSLVALVLAVTLSSARAEGPDDQYVRIYDLIQQADTLNNSDQRAAATAKYLEALTALQRFQKMYPDWNVKVVNFRLNYLASQVAAVTGKASPSTTPAKPATPVPPVITAPSTAPAAAPAIIEPTVRPDLDRQLSALQGEVRRLQADKSLLQSKLKEALATQPAAVDPRELAKAQGQIRSLLKENELLKTSTAQERAGPAAAGADSKLLARTQAALTEANGKLADQTQLNAKLAAEKETLQARLQRLTSGAEASEALRLENRVLKQQLAEAKSPAGKSEALSLQLAQAEARIASLQSNAEILRLENIALENRVKTLGARTVNSVVTPPAGRAEDLRRIKLLEVERYDLARKLDAANKELSGRKGKATVAKVEELSDQIATLRARLEVYEARAVPYTAEELALFKQPKPVLAAADSKVGPKAVKELPRGTASLVAEAQREFAAKRFDQAEEKYLEVLRRDENNVYTLANLAAIQLELNRLDEADKHIQKALAVAPNDAYSLSILGYLRFRQKRYDEALDALSRAARLDPGSAEIQNYLGVTLSHKGQRAAAETALRKAIELDPGYGSAHNNLAVIYATQQPPMMELARWHYRRALAAGNPRNPDLEKMLEPKPSGAKAQ